MLATWEERERESLLFLKSVIASGQVKGPILYWLIGFKMSKTLSHIRQTLVQKNAELEECVCMARSRTKQVFVSILFFVAVVVQRAVAKCKPNTAV